MKHQKLSVSSLALALLTMFFAGCASARGTLADVEVVDRDTGETLQTYYHRGQVYVAGQPGHRYAVRVRNQTNDRILTVVSVDGVNVITGQTASASQSGYVLSGWQSTEINGWRKSQYDVAQFVFTRLSDSYAARTGRPGDVGVIGVAVFREKYTPPPPPVTYQAPESSAQDSMPGLGAAREASRPAAPAAKSSASGRAAAVPPMEREERLGTGHGQRESSYVSYTDFVRASSYPAEVVSIRYDSYQNLLAQGVIPRNRRYPSPEPRPFPNGNGYVPDPR